MSAPLLLSVVLGYFLLLLAVAWRTSRRADNEAFFIGNRNSHWLLVAFGMVGTSLSGVTFISVPGTVGSQGFGYLQIVIGHVLGYLIVAFVLVPLYYRQGVSSIYHYLDGRFGPRSYRTGAPRTARCPCRSRSRSRPRRAPRGPAPCRARPGRARRAGW